MTRIRNYRCCGALYVIEAKRALWEVRRDGAVIGTYDKEPHALNNLFNTMRDDVALVERKAYATLRDAHIQSHILGTDPDNIERFKV